MFLLIAASTTRTHRPLSKLTSLLNWVGAVHVLVEVLHGGVVLATREDAGRVGTLYYHRVRRSSAYEISVDWNDEYEVYYRLDTTRIAADYIPPRDGRDGRLRVEKRAVPLAAQQGGFDNILVVPSGGDYVYGFGHVIFYDAPPQ